ncbi:hypothetical protein HBI56_215670 [Parastagonospora nodorum]|uniref:Uncharacterized protein n=1 Tax=Phaeosphaeria nodorum (strain SN15 / ATCC MYA-4574 / FGSC 10173) TaxID=321614 RepID=A0A7U2EZU3_PHANO|nr:hypothetical protein HBH56_176790 [Parastagonospora nodorum]QRC96159.1 hypothetical protein JI435_011240 [Parastagonospora nodorum SN15]KAH3926493.1 hypothetical protein HBH54_166370 [Parastagonospora nodorum]KAH3939131.1 hypothetical protein HBH53_240550 [Parastagonospora nodorum]KAH3965672.1 hypothetical protein HBH52_203010 [Parastagonospora nodorum]
MKAFTVIALGLLPFLTSADSVSVEDGLGCKSTCGRNTCDVACYKATFIDGAGNRFSTNCGIIAGYVPEACPGESRSQTANKDIGGGYRFRSKGKTVFITSGNGQYNAQCDLPDGNNPASCDLTGDTDPAKRAVEFSV